MGIVAIITLLTQTVEAVRHGRDAERQARTAAQLMNRATLWSAAELDARLGRRRIGQWDLVVSNARPSLYTLSVLDTLNGSLALETAVYRPAQSSNAP
jgi:hypothetical protein